MSLNNRERQTLTDLEHVLLEQDPALVEQFASWRLAPPPVPPWRRRVLIWFGWRRWP